MSHCKNIDVKYKMQLEGKIESFNEYEYEDLDCSRLPMFSGGFVNFGLWKNIGYKSKSIAEKDREKSSIDLYVESLKYLNIAPHDTVLEVGCGAGTGIPIIWEHYHPKKIIGLDISKSQISRASKHNANLVAKGILFLVANPAEDTRLPVNSINKIISIESLQNFTSIDSFFNESQRILSRDGMIVISTIFANGLDNSDKINQLKPGNMKRKDHIFPIEIILNKAKQNFTANVISIGDSIFEGYNTYISQLGLNNKALWSSNFYDAYKKGWIDYYILILTKANQA